MNRIYRFVNSIRHPFLWAFLLLVAFVCFLADVEQLTSLSNFFGGFAIPVTACIAAYVAWRQYATDKLRLKIESYDRRLKVYESVTAFIPASLRNGCTLADCSDFYRDTVQADFLFGSEIRHFITELFRRAVELTGARVDHEYHRQIEDENFDYEKSSERMLKLGTWIAEQDEIALELFKPYLHLADPL